MNDERALRELEARCARMLHAAAPVAPPDLAARCLARTAVEPQRRGLGQRVLHIGPPLAAVAAVVVLAALVGIQLGNLIPDRAPGGLPTASPSASAQPRPTPAPTPSPAASPAPSGSAALPDGWVACTNQIDGYTVGYPADWFTNAEIDLDITSDGPPTGACTFFGRQPLELAPNAGLPSTVVVRFATEETVPPPSDGSVVVREEEVVVGGRPATILETEHATEQGAPFTAPGDRAYRYAVELVGGGYLVVSTTSLADGDYEENRAVLDAMMATLRLSG